MTGLPWPIAVRPAQHTVEPALAGARNDALSRLRSAIVTSAGGGQPVGSAAT